MLRSFIKLVLKAAAVLPVVVVKSACRKPSSNAVRIGQASYNLPSPGTRAVVLPPQGPLYVALAPPGADFELIHAERDVYRRNWAGLDAPLVTHINDVPSDKFEIHTFPGGITVCRLDKPAMSCGLRVDDGGIGWTVIFEYQNLKLSSEIRAEALKKLRDYRQ